MLAILVTVAAVLLAYLWFSRRPRPAKFVGPTPSSSVTSASSGAGSKKIDPSKPTLVVVYASQSGTAETFAFDLADEGRSYPFNIQVLDIEDIEPEDMADKQCLVLLVATHGEGDPTDSAEDFTEWLDSADRESDELEGVKFAVFGLGNTQYEFYNEMAKKVHKQFGKMGAESICELGLGDDDGSLEEDFEEWKVKFWESALSTFGGSMAGVDLSFESAFTIEWSDEGATGPAEVARQQKFQRGHLVDGKHNGVVVPVRVSRELRPDTSDGRTLHIEFNLDDSNLHYQTADNLAVVPRNDYKLVGKFVRRLALRPHAVFQLKAIHQADTRRCPVQGLCTVQNALLWRCDINAVPRKRLCQQLVQYATEPKQAARLRHLTSDDGKQEFHDWIEQGTSLLDVLTEFSSIDVPFCDFLQLVQRIQPRYYTIASSKMVNPTTVHITVIMEEKTLKNGNQFKGLATGYLDTLRQGIDQCMIFVRASSFRLPRPVTRPVIMIGPGTGVAPFRAFIQEAMELKARGREVGEWALAFGCRNEAKDWIYKDEMLAAKEAGVLDHLWLAFSRDGPKKVYVQDKLRENGAKLWQLIDQEKANLYVCGATGMGKGVRDALTDVIADNKKCSHTEADDYVKKLLKESRYIQELWG